MARSSGNRFELNELSVEQRRQLVDARQLFEAYSTARADWDHSYAGSMRWVKRKGHEYLHFKRGKRERSIGPRSDATEATYRAFLEGRTKLRGRLDGLAMRLDKMAPVNRALALGRMPALAAKIVRKLGDEKLLGTHVLLVGTHALFAYEARAGVLLSADLLATTDADLLWDARNGVALLGSEIRRDGLIGLLRKVDRSFEVRRAGDFRAVNRDGFYVDVIRPQDRDDFRIKPRATIGDRADDLRPAPIFGLQWLVNAPRFETIVIGEDGYPAPIVAPDPRAFALHKLWLSARRDRDPVKAPRDREQALSVAALCRTYLALDFDAEDLRALPKRLRALIDVLPSARDGSDDGPAEPGW